MAARDRFGPLSEKPFRLLWLGQTLSRIGDSMIYVAVPFAVIELTGSATDLGLVLAAFTVSRISLLLVGGVWADRLSRRAVMIAADGVRIASQGTIAWLLVSGDAEVWHLLVTQAVAGAASAFFAPASTGLVPATVSDDRLQQANALIGLSGRTVSIFGPVTAGILVAAAGPGSAFAVDSATFAASAALLLALRVTQLAQTVAAKPFLADLKEGWDAVRSRVWLWANLVVFAVANVAGAAFVVLGPLIVAEELGGASDWGIVLAGGGVGGVLGGIVALRVRPVRPLVSMSVAILPVAIPLLLLVEPGSALALAFGYGAFVAGVVLANAVWTTVLQQRVPRQSLSRVSSYDWLVSALFMPVGYTLAGPLADAVGMTPTLVGAAAVAVAAPLLVLLVPEVRELRTHPAAKPALAGR